MANTKKVIRNLHPMPVNLRFGSKRDPYYITLSRRGMLGDVVEIPADFTDHPDFNRNVNVTFEIISSAEAKKIEYESNNTQTAMETDRNFKIERVEDTSTTVGLVDADPKHGGVIRTGDTNPMRSRARGTVDNPVPESRGEAEGDAPPVSPDLPAFGGVEKAPTKATRSRAKK